MLVHVHIPKTGGTSVHKLLANHLKLASYDAAYDSSPSAFIRDAALTGFDVVSGHLFHQSYLEGPFPVPLKLTTVLREPAARYFRHSIPNLQTAYILRAASQDVVHPNQLSQKHGQLAFELLQKKFWYVTTTDTLVKSWERLCNVCGVPRSPVYFLMAATPLCSKCGIPTNPRIPFCACGTTPKNSLKILVRHPPPNAAELLRQNPADAELYKLVCEINTDGTGILFGNIE